MDGMLTNSGSGDALMLAAYEAERRAFSQPVIVGAFRRRDLWPFNPKELQAFVRANLGLVQMGQTVADAVSHAASEVIQAAQERVDEAQTRSTRGKTVVQRVVVHSTYLLLEKHREMEAEATKEVASKKTRREERERRKEDQGRLLADKAEAR